MNPGTPIHEAGTVILATENYVLYNDQVLIHRRSLTKSRFPGFILGPGGRLDQGEDVVTAAVREIYEETGIKVPATDVTLAAVAIHHHLDRGEIWVNFISRSDLTKPPAQIRHSDEGTSEWIPVKSLKDEGKIFPPSKDYIEHIISDQPGILYTNVEFRGGEPVRVLSSTLVK